MQINGVKYRHHVSMSEIFQVFVKMDKTHIIDDIRSSDSIAILQQLIERKMGITHILCYVSATLPSQFILILVRRKSCSSVPNN